MIHIRNVERADLDALFALDRECFRPEIAYSKAYLRYFLNHPRSISFAAEDLSGKIVGFAIAESHFEQGRRIGHLITIDVAESARLLGVGRLLIQAILDRLYELAAAAIKLEVAVDNAGAQAFYARLGFIQTGRILDFYPGNLDALTMEMTLA